MLSALPSSEVGVDELDEEWNRDNIPIDEESVHLLFAAGVPAFKVASGDITYHRLLKKIGETGLPIILSAGASNDNEIIENLTPEEGNEMLQF